MPFKIARIAFFIYVMIAVVCLIAGALFLFAPPEMKPDAELTASILLVGAPWSFGMMALLNGSEAPWMIFVMLGIIPLGLNSFILWWVQRRLSRK